MIVFLPSMIGRLYTILKIFYYDLITVSIALLCMCHRSVEVVLIR